MTTLDFIRHGEPVGGRKYRGQIDDPLSEKGWAQMRAALDDHAPWTRVISSPLLRCRAFAEALAMQHELPLEFEARFKEIGFGIWEGKTAEQIERAWPGTLGQFKADPIHARPSGAEPLDEFYSRVAAGIERILNAYPDEHVLVVGHAGVIRMALAYALAIPLANAYRIEVASAGITRLRFDGARAALVFHGGRL